MARILPVITIAVCVVAALAVSFGIVVWFGGGQVVASLAILRLLGIVGILSAIPAVIMLPRIYSVHVAKDVLPVLLLATIVGALVGFIGTFAVEFVVCGPLCW